MVKQISKLSHLEEKSNLDFSSLQFCLLLEKEVAAHSPLTSWWQTDLLTYGTSTLGAQTCRVWIIAHKSVPSLFVFFFVRWTRCRRPWSTTPLEFLWSRPSGRLSPATSARSVLTQRYMEQNKTEIHITEPPPMYILWRFCNIFPLRIYCKNLWPCLVSLKLIVTQRI